MCQFGWKCLWKEVLQGTKAPKEVTNFCGNVRFSEQLLCVLECTIGWELLFSKHSDCLYTMAGDQGLCFTVSWAVSMFWLIHGCFYTSKSSSIVQAFTGENNYEAKFPYELYQSYGVFHFSFCGCCLMCAALGMFTAWPWLSRIEGHKWQEATVIVSKPAFPQEPAASQIFSESISGLFLVLPSPFCTPHPCWERSSHFLLTVLCSPCSSNL